MNKKLVALAVAGVLAAPLAQAQTANVTLYGRVNLDVEFVNGNIYNSNAPQNTLCDKTFNKNCVTTNPWQYRMGTNSSRFGLRGTESLGGGLNAIFQVESSINPAQSGGTLAGRESFVGLQGGWGTFKIGRFLMPYDDLHPIFGNVPTLTTSILSTASLWAQGFQAKNAGGFDDRVANSIRYDTANLSGFTASFQYGAQGTNYAQPGTPNTTVGNTPHAGVFGANALYANGPIQLGVGYEGNYGVRGRQAVPPCVSPPLTTGCPTGKQLNDYAFSVAGAYKFSIVQLGAVYERLKYDYQGVAGGDITRNFFGLSLTGNVGPGQMYVYYGQANNGAGSAPNGARVAGLVKGPDTRAVQWEVSYTYPLSKRTLTYVGYNKIGNDHNAAYNFNINPYNPVSSSDSSYATPGGKPGGLVFGMVHFF
jgi:predicted porin